MSHKAELQTHMRVAIEESHQNLKDFLFGRFDEMIARLNHLQDQLDRAMQERDLLAEQAEHWRHVAYVLGLEYSEEDCGDAC